MKYLFGENAEATQSELLLIAGILGVDSSQIKEVHPLHGGCVASVRKISFKKPVHFAVNPVGEALSEVVLKSLNTGATNTEALSTEALMLKYLAEESHLPVPRVLSAAKTSLVLSLLPGDSVMTPARQQDTAKHIAALHGIQPKPDKTPAEHKNCYGFAYDTYLGGLRQPNPWTDSWRNFYREQRIWYTAQAAHREGLLSVKVMRRLDKFCSRLDRWLDEPQGGPSLVHGDLWTTNILGVGDAISGFIDPAIYYGHPAMDLAFGTLFNTFQEPFFKTYAEYKTVPEGFFEIVKDLYNLYPLLVHVRIFGPGYVSDIEGILKRVGC